MFLFSIQDQHLQLFGPASDYMLVWAHPDNMLSQPNWRHRLLEYLAWACAFTSTQQVIGRWCPAATLAWCQTPDPRNSATTQLKRASDIHTPLDIFLLIWVCFPKFPVSFWLISVPVKWKVWLLDFFHFFSCLLLRKRVKPMAARTQAQEWGAGMPLLGQGVHFLTATSYHVTQGPS